MLSGRWRALVTIGLVLVFGIQTARRDDETSEVEIEATTASVRVSVTAEGINSSTKSFTVSLYGNVTDINDNATTANKTTVSVEASTTEELFSHLMVTSTESSTITEIVMENVSEVLQMEKEQGKYHLLTREQLILTTIASLILGFLSFIGYIVACSML